MEVCSIHNLWIVIENIKCIICKRYKHNDLKTYKNFTNPCSSHAKDFRENKISNFERFEGEGKEHKRNNWWVVLILGLLESWLCNGY